MRQDKPPNRSRSQSAAQRANTMVSATAEILADGKARDAGSILLEGRKRGTLHGAASKQSLYIDLTAYIEREISQGRRPSIVQDAKNHYFRINHPVDDWPPVVLPPRPRNVSIPSLTAMSARLQATSTGTDPAAFEEAACDAFALLGFITCHIGGNNAPDGTLDAPLGPLGYRAMLECKSAKGGVSHNTHPEEAAKFRELYGGTFAVLLGPGFGDDATQLSELKVHGVSRWTVSDLVTAIENDVDVYECRDLFGPGPVRDRLADLVWLRQHGSQKRRRVLCDVLQRAGFAAQREVVGQVSWSDAPVITLDVAMVLVEQALREAGAATGATRDEVRCAMDDLVRSESAAVVPGRDGIVIRAAGPHRE